MNETLIDDVTSLHRAAMAAADDADDARRRDDHDRFNVLILDALDKERSAADLVAEQLSLEPTRSVLHRSAASLAMEAGEYNAALALIERGLAGQPPADIAAELSTLAEEVKARQRNFARERLPGRLLIGRSMRSTTDVAGESAFGRQLEEWRHSRGMTQKQLAQTMGYDVVYIAKIEHGARRPSGPFLSRLSEMAGTSAVAVRPASFHGAYGSTTKLEFGPWLRAWRQTRRMTQQQLAGELGYGVSYIAKIEGGRRLPSRQVLARISIVAGQSPESLLRAAMGAVERPPLPQPPDRVIGRDEAIDALTRLLKSPQRFVSLVGPPGIGKTRLAGEIALRLDTELPGGSWWVPLVDVVDPGDVPERVRSALGASGAGADPVDAVIERMRNVDALMVLDNFDHVLDARPIVSRILAGTSRLKMVVTSRVHLDLPVESVFLVAPLAFPSPSAEPEFETVQASAAVKLFVARARMARPNFRLTPSNYGAVLRACSRLDGVPLAIVLAASGVRDAAGLVDELEGRLDRRYPWADDGPEHQRTLEAAIRWSWNVLNAEEKGVLAALSVLVGGFTASAAAVICEIDIATAREVIDGLTRKSLVEEHPDALGGPRFSLLETIKAFAARRLDEDERAQLNERHAAHFVSFASDCERRLVGPDQVGCAHAFADDLENFQVAFDWSLRHDPDRAIQMAASSWRFFLLTDIPTGQRWLEAAIAAAPAPTVARATALAGAGALMLFTGQLDLAQRHLDEAQVLAEELDLKDVASLVLTNNGAAAEQQGQLEDAHRYFSEALSSCDRVGDRRGRAYALNGLGMIYRRRGELAQAWPLWAEAAELFRAIGDGTNEAHALANIAWAAEAIGQLDEAQATSLKCRRLQIALGDTRGVAATTSALGNIAFIRGDYDDAWSLQLDALRLFQRLGDHTSLASTLIALAGTAERTNSPEHAVELLGVAQALRYDTAAQPGAEEQRMIDRIHDRCRAALGADGYNQAKQVGQTAVPGASASDPIERVGRYLRRLGEYLPDDAEAAEMAPARPRPAGLHWVELGRASRALIDPVTLEAFDVDGRLIGFDIAGVPGTPTASTAADAVGRFAAAGFALDDATDLGRVLLLHQRAAALRSNALDWAVTDDDRALAAAAAEAGHRGLGPQGLLLLGLSIETVRETTGRLGTLTVDGRLSLLGAVIAAAPDLVTEALDAVAAAADRAVTAVVRLVADAPLSAGHRALAAGLHAAVTARRGQPAAREWAIAARRWDTVSTSVAAYCKQLEAAAGDEPAVTTFDAVAVLGGYVT